MVSSKILTADFLKRNEIGAVLRFEVPDQRFRSRYIRERNCGHIQITLFNTERVQRSSGGIGEKDYS